MLVLVLVLVLRFTGETGTILKVVKNPDGASRAMVLTDMSSKELEVCACVRAVLVREPPISDVQRLSCVPRNCC